MNAGVFGNLAVVLFFTTLTFFQFESFKHKMVTFVSLFSGLIIIVLSGTRGAWLSFLILSGAYFYFFYKQKTKLRKKSKIIIVLIIATLLTAASFNQTLKDRSQLASIEFTEWMAGSNSPISSVGVRLEMYRLAINKIEDVPFFGHGYRTSNIVVFKDSQSEAGQLSYTYNHLHNAYLTNYFNGGIVLLGALLLLLFVPLIIFLKANKKNCENPIYISGILLILGYSSFGMVNILLGDTYMNGFYVFFLAIFLLLTNKSIKLPVT